MSGAMPHAGMPMSGTMPMSGAMPLMVMSDLQFLDAMVAQLRAAGIPVSIDPEAYPNGRFARLQDPEGNPIELWQPREN